MVDFRPALVAWGIWGIGWSLRIGRPIAFSRLSICFMRRRRIRKWSIVWDCKWRLIHVVLVWLRFDNIGIIAIRAVIYLVIWTCRIIWSYWFPLIVVRGTRQATFPTFKQPTAIIGWSISDIEVGQSCCGMRGNCVKSVRYKLCSESVRWHWSRVSVFIWSLASEVRAGEEERPVSH